MNGIMLSSRYWFLTQLLCSQCNMVWIFLSLWNLLRLALQSSAWLIMVNNLCEKYVFPGSLMQDHMYILQIRFVHCVDWMIYVYQLLRKITLKITHSNEELLNFSLSVFAFHILMSAYHMPIQYVNWGNKNTFCELNFFYNFVLGVISKDSKSWLLGL